MPPQGNLHWRYLGILAYVLIAMINLVGLPVATPLRQQCCPALSRRTAAFPSGQQPL